MKQLLVKYNNVSELYCLKLFLSFHGSEDEL